LVVLGIVFQAATILLPAGFNSDAAAVSLLGYDMVDRGEWIFYSNAAHTERALVFPISAVTPIIPIFLIFGFVDWGVKATIVLYNMASAFFLYKLAKLWFDEKTAALSLVFFLFSPWVVQQFSLWTPTAFLFTVMPIYVHQLAVKDRRYLPMAYSLMGLSFYFFLTAKIVVCFYIALYFLYNRKSFLEKTNILSFTLFVVAILPWIFFTMYSPQKEIIFRPGLALPNVNWLVTTAFFFITPHLFAAFVCVPKAIIRVVRKEERGFVPLLLSGWLLSVIPAIILSPYLRPRVIYYAAPAFIVLSSLFYSRLKQGHLYAGVLSFVLFGALVSGVFATDPHSMMPGGSEYGLDEAAAYLMSAEDVGWVYTDYRMDKQLLFYSQRKLPLRETGYPCLDCPTFPWKGYYPEANISKGCYHYLFWAGMEDEEYFTSHYPDSKKTYDVAYPSGEPAINVYKICLQE
jgi:hypothetical protein